MKRKNNKGTYKTNTAMDEDTFRHKFRTEKAARKYLEQARWQGKPKCSCGSTKTRAWRKDRPGYYRCCECGKQFSVKIGTIFEKTHVPLRKWLIAWYYIVTDRKGISSIALSKKIGVTQKTAWLLESKIRFALGSGNHGFVLKGIVQADETYAGGRVKNMHERKKPRLGSGPIGKSPIFGIVEQGGRVSAVVVPNVKRKTLLGVIKKRVEKGTMLHTDEARQYLVLKKHGYKHEAVNHSLGEYVKSEDKRKGKRGSAKQIVNKMATTNSVESMWTLLKRGFYGTYHKFSKEYLQGYVNEVVFRLNEGHCKYPTMDRVNAIAENCLGKSITYRQLVGN
jgi:transposase-like protein